MKIGILASGGDGSGMNAFLYKLARLLRSKHKLILFNKGYYGLINNDVCNFDFDYIKQHKNDGGIMIKSSRCPEFKTAEGLDKAYATYNLHNLDFLVVMGGNGSLKGAIEFIKKGANVLFVPCTIDNDVEDSEYCIGHDTACKNCVEYIKNIDATMQSFDRVCIYETMGRDCPQIAQKVANMIDVDYLFIDERHSIEDCINTIKKQDKRLPRIIIRENFVNSEKLKKALTEIGYDTKVCVVGYFQRGGSPTKQEIQNAHNFAKVIYSCIKNKITNKIAVMENQNFVAKQIY